MLHHRLVRRARLQVVGADELHVFLLGLAQGSRSVWQLSREQRPHAAANRHSDHTWNRREDETHDLLHGGSSVRVLRSSDRHTDTRHRRGNIEEMPFLAQSVATVKRILFTSHNSHLARLTFTAFGPNVPA